MGTHTVSILSYMYHNTISASRTHLVARQRGQVLLRDIHKAVRVLAFALQEVGHVCDTVLEIPFLLPQLCDVSLDTDEVLSCFIRRPQG